MAEQRWCAYCGEPILTSPCPCKPLTMEAVRRADGISEYESWSVISSGSSIWGSALCEDRLEDYVCSLPKGHTGEHYGTRAPKEIEPAVAWLIVRHSGTSAPSREVVLSPLTDQYFMDEGDEAWPLVIRRADDRG